MKLEGVTYTVRSRWAPDAETPPTIGARFLAFVDRLDPLNPVMANWLWGDDGGALPLATVRPNLTQYVERNVATHNGEPDPRDGYNLFALGGPAVSDRGSSRSVRIYTHTGSRWNNEVSFEIGSLINLPDPDLISYPIYRGALAGMAAAFPCPYVWARYFVSEKTVWIPTPGGGATAAPGTPLEPFDGIWIAYLSAPLVAGLTPPLELFPERTPGGGMILSAVKDHIDPTNPDHVRRSILLRDIMIKHAAKPNFRGVVEEGGYPPRIGPY
jgi:hypothetical protein